MTNDKVKLVSISLRFHKGKHTKVQSMDDLGMENVGSYRTISQLGKYDLSPC